MTVPFARHYQAELAYLRELGREFADRHPSLAGFLREPGDDPDVERLLEGFAFLTSRIRERIDGGIPEVAESLCSTLYPHTVRPGPASSVVAFSPDLRSLRTAQKIPNGTELRSKEVQGAQCRFRTIGDLDLLPVELLDVTLDESLPDVPALSFSLRTTEAGRLALHTSSSIRLHLWGKRSQSACLALWFGRHLESVEYVDEEQVIPLRGAGLQHALRDRADAHTAWPRVSLEGPRLLREYLDFFEKMMFFDLTALTGLPPTGPTQFSLRLRFRRPPPLPERPTARHIRLHCAPVVNLFETSAEPFIKLPHRGEHLLRVSGLAYEQAEVVDILSVEGLLRGQTSRRNYQATSAQPQSLPTGFHRQSNPNYGVRRLRSPVDGRLDSYLTFSPTAQDSTAEVETISADLLCTNRMLPTELRIGDICVPSSQCPTRATFSNISQVLTPTCPPIGNPSYWHYLGQVSSSFSSLVDKATMCAYLALQNVRESTDPLFRGNQKRCESIRSVQARAADRCIRRRTERGIRTTVVLEEDHFEGVGDAFCFGMVLQSVLTDRVGLDTFHELDVQLHPSQVAWRFAPLVGTREPI